MARAQRVPFGPKKVDAYAYAYAYVCFLDIPRAQSLRAFQYTKLQHFRSAIKILNFMTLCEA
jgi:hypothetical protein